MAFNKMITDALHRGSNINLAPHLNELISFAERELNLTCNFYQEVALEADSHMAIMEFRLRSNTDWAHPVGNEISELISWIEARPNREDLHSPMARWIYNNGLLILTCLMG